MVLADLADMRAALSLLAFCGLAIAKRAALGNRRGGADLSAKMGKLLENSAPLTAA
jgi:hypothetical protein